tara:strand:+ start:222 stop:2048 length:1827 start_codon:yes stop_codon:yes gene_type:complete
LNIPYDIIHKLRQLPRHGRRIDSGELEEFTRKFDGLTKNVVSSQEKMQKGFQSLGDTMKGMFDAATAFDHTNKSVMSLQAGIGNLVKIQDEHNKKIHEAVKAGTFLEERTKDLNKAFGISSEKTKVFADGMRSVAATVGVGEKKLFKYAANLKDLTAGFMLTAAATEKGDDAFGSFNDKLLAGQSFMQNNINLSEEQANKFEMYSRSVGTTAIDMSIQLQSVSKAFADKTGLDALQVQKDIMQGIANTSQEIQGQYSKMPGQLELAVLKASKLGTTMDQLHKTGDSLLNIESSVGSELEYQMLTGRRLLDDEGKSLTNAYRMATIKGDGAKQAELMAKFIEDEGDNLETNMFARKKAAELFGTDEATLMKMKRQKDLLSEMGIDNMMKLDFEDIKGVTEKLREEGASPEEIEKLLKNADTRTSADRTADASEALLAVTVGKKSQETDIGTGKVEADNFVNEQLKVSEQFRNMDKSSLKLIGSLEMLKLSSEAAVEPIKQFAGIVPGLQERVTKFTTALTSTIPSIGVGDTLSVTEVDDAYITSDGQVIEPAGNDNAIFYQDGGPFDPARGMQFDYDALAAAMSRVKIVAQTEREVGSSSTMNGQYNYG